MLSISSSMDAFLSIHVAIPAITTAFTTEHFKNQRVCWWCRSQVDSQLAEMQSLARRLKLLLASLGLMDEARGVSRTFRLKEAV